MNAGFGIGIVIIPFIVLLIAFWVFKKTKKLSHSAIVAVIGLVVFYNVQTYGPRNSLDTASIPDAPYKPEIKAGSQLIPHDDRWEKFDEAVKSHEERQALD